MNVNFEKKDNVNGVITITLAEADYTEKVNKELKTIGQKHPIKGFRPGHAPLSLLKKFYGKQVLGEVVNDETKVISKDLALEGKTIIFRRGKKKYYIGLI